MSIDEALRALESAAGRASDFMRDCEVVPVVVVRKLLTTRQEVAPVAGPWEAIAVGGKIVVASEEFGNDVWLYVTGDFDDTDAHLEYADRIARILNSTGQTSDARDGVSLIAAERRRQMESEGWSLEHDDAYEINELACAAACYVVPPQFRDPLTIMAELWPWDESWWKPGDRIRELAKAGALIAAEIDRLERAAVRQEADSRE